jgi:hypothetical protein
LRDVLIMIVTATTLGSLIPLAWGTGANSLFGAIGLATAGGTVTPFNTSRDDERAI